MDTRYNYLTRETDIYQLWETADAFNPDAAIQNSPKKNSKKHFSIIMPPPNANDALHVGHALFVSIEDILIRYHRMLGDDTVWIPGTDHAGIETQFLFEKKLQKQGKSRFNFDRLTLFNMIWEYVRENSGIAVSQIKKLGASADWSRFCFTLDPQIVSSVIQTFKKLHEDDLVYRDLKLVNYCTKCGTSYSELEVDHVEQTSKLYYLKYGPFTLATTRPETKFADTAVAVHPADARYQKFIDTTITVEGLNGPFELRVIADEYVDPEFGTGVVKITPYHDFNDFEVWQRHKDEIPVPQQVVGHDGKLTAVAGKYAGLRVKAAREQIEQDLLAKGLLEKVDTNYRHTVGVCYRCKQVIEPLPLPQFFIKVKAQHNNLVEKALAALDSQETLIMGAGREKILRHWLTNLKDWNISRQIVWGIHMPVWYEVDGNEQAIMVSFLTPEGIYEQGTLEELLTKHSFETITAGLQRVQANIAVPYIVSETEPTTNKRYLQETDTFDTWFSSGQWPVVTLQNTRSSDFERFYPTSVMETGYDILPFWVMRMLLLGIYTTGKSPFSVVYLHGLVRDQKGQKMSKSKGNVINPLEVVEKYGADALRMALVIRSTPGQDKSVGDPDFKAMRNFANKIWNAARYVATADTDATSRIDTTKLDQDKVVTEKLAAIATEATRLLDTATVGLAADYLYNEFWHWFCDVCIEQHKQKTISTITLLDGMVMFLKLLHPFMPFVTETIWQEYHASKLIASEEKLLITAGWPK